MAIGRAALRIGRFFQPAVKPLAVGAGGSGLLLAGAHTIKTAGAAANPPIQSGNIDPDPEKNGDGVSFLFDPRTGSLFTSGGQVEQQQDEQRSQDRNQTTLLVAGVAAVGLVAAFALKK